ncbi:MAG: molybdopterin-dependent oxidoreductase [Bacteroidetes bacterium]|nr:molybdopterin-dependent oxidoreductase [Bacteroidota bacterium]
MPTVTTACPRNCYSTCGLRVTVEDGRLRQIEPVPENRATDHGACLKGLSYVERVHSPHRLLYPLRRNLSGGFDRISWDLALGTIAERLRAIREEHGPKSLLYYSSSGTKGLLNGVGASFWKLFGGYTTTYGDLCWPAGLEATRLTLGSNEHNAPWDLANAKLIIMWGKNAAETNIHQMTFVDQALQRGAKLVVIDPRRTETAERASLLIQPRPGTDAAIALAVGHELISKKWIDRAFIAAHVHGYDAYVDQVLGCTSQWASQVSGVPKEQIKQLAELIASSAPVTICAGFGMQRYTNSGQTMRAMMALLAITGNIGKPGAGWIFANLRTQVFGEKDPIAFYPPHAPDPLVRVSISTAMLGPQILSTQDPPIKAIWVERGNPIPQNPETPTVIAAFRSVDFRVVVEEVMTDTAREADIVLPAKTFFEQTDVIGAYWHDYLQLRAKVIEPPGEVKPESEIYWLLAERLGISKAEAERHIPTPNDAAVESWLNRRLAHLPGVTLERLREGPIRMPDEHELAFADLTFSTPSGKIELDSSDATSLWSVDRLPSYQEPVESARTGDLSRFPLHLLTPNTKNRIHSQFGHLEMLKAIEPGPVLQMHPADAQCRNIRSGNRIRVFNERGELTVPVRLDRGIRPGCVALHNGWWLQDGGAVNVLSKARETDMGHGAAFHENLVEVEAAK